MEAGGIEPPLQVCKTCVLPLPLRPRECSSRVGEAPGDRRRGRGVDVDGVAHVVGVAAGQHDAHRGSRGAHPVEHQLVAGAQARLGQRELAEPVALPRVGAGQVERDVGVAAAVEGELQRRGEGAQVARVADAAGQVDVESDGMRWNG